MSLWLALVFHRCKVYWHSKARKTAINQYKTATISIWASSCILKYQHCSLALSQHHCDVPCLVWAWLSCALPCVSMTLMCLPLCQDDSDVPCLVWAWLSCALPCVSSEPLHVEVQSDSEYENVWDLELMEDGVIMTYSTDLECVREWVCELTLVSGIHWVQSVYQCVEQSRAVSPLVQLLSTTFSPLKKSTRWGSVWMSEWVCEWVCECVSECVSEWVSVWVCEWLHE